MASTTSSDDQPVLCLGGCGHVLRSRKALARGYGEHCWRKLHAERRLRRRRALRRHAPPAHPAAIPDQLAFELWDEPPLPDVLHGLRVHDVPTRGLL